MVDEKRFDETLASLEGERDRVWARYWELVGAINATRHWKAEFGITAPPLPVNQE